MNVKATSIDHHRADVTQREVFACTHEQVNKIYEIAGMDPGVSGAVLINTCNRTELYLSLEEGREVDPFGMLCDALDIDRERYEELQLTLENEDALRHLCLLTAGAESQLWGDSQIITQVGDAVEEARKNGSTDSVLNTMFRLGITAGKEIRTNVELYINDASTAVRAAERIMMEPEIYKVLVIGNGSIGRMVASELARSGVMTYMTLRRYNHGQSVVPEGVEAVPYSDRYEIMESCDGVVSATSSPHVVVTRDGLEAVDSLPRVFVDMAMPRDIEETVGEMDGVKCYNIDDISRGRHAKLKESQLSQLEEYIEEQVEEYRRWEASRERVEKKIERLTSRGGEASDRKHFPLFIDTQHQRVLVIGGGNIAERRVMTMAEFAFEITVVSEELTGALEKMAEGGAIGWVRGHFDVPGAGGCEETASGDGAGEIESLIDDSWMVLACTNDRAVNRCIGEVCRRKNKLVNVCDARNESNFWFPAVALNDELTVGLVGRGTDHMNVKKAAAALRDVVEEKSYK